METRINHRTTDSPHVLKNRRWLVRMLLVCLGALLLWQPGIARADEAADGCMAVTCVSSSPQLASLDSTQSELLNAVLGSLLNTDLQLDAVDTQNLVNIDIGTEELLNQLATDLDIPVADVLSTDMDLGQILDALSSILNVEEQIAAAHTLDELATTLDPLGDTIQLGDLLQIDSDDGQVSNIDLDVLELITGVIQLYSFDNMVGATVPITLNGSDLGIDDVLLNVELQAYITEPPVIVCGSDESTFHSAALRLKLNLSLAETALDTTNLINDLLAPLQSLLGGSINISAEATLADLELYAEIASGDGLVSFVDAVAQSVNVQATPGAVDLYLGTIDDAVFFNRSSEVMPGDVNFGTIADVTISAELALAEVLNIATSVEAKAFTQSSDGVAENLTFTGPYPQTISTTSSATFVTNLLDTLLANLELEISTSLDDQAGVPLGLDEIVLSAIEELLGTDAEGLLGDTLNSVMMGLVDPVLDILGADLGIMNVTVLGIDQRCPDLSISKSHIGSFARAGSDNYTLEVTNMGTLATSGPITMIDTLPAGMSFLTFASEAWSLSSVEGQLVTFIHNGSLAVGESISLLLAVQIAPDIAASVSNSAMVSTMGDLNVTNNTAIDITIIGPVNPNDDSDDDCVPNSVEDLNGNGNYFDDDTDGDGTPNFLDNDDDGDSLHTCTVEDEDEDGDPTNDDTDGDGTPNYLDPDDDDDTVPTIDEDPNGDGDPTNDDTDGDGTPNYLDPDDDNDTVPTEDEDPNNNGDPQDDDTDNDGTPDYLDPDDDGDGKPTKDEDPNNNGDPRDDDSDGDGTPDYLDPDDENPDFQDDDRNSGNVFLPLINRSCVAIPPTPCL